MSVLVRFCEIGDLGAMCALENWAIRETVAHFGVTELSETDVRAAFEGRGHHVWLVAEIGGEFAGFARSGPWKARESYRMTAEFGVYVRPEHHGRGVGRALYERLFEEMAELGFATILAGITLPNEASVRLHEGFGMVKVAEMPDVGFKFGEWHSVGYWAKSLRES